MPNEVRFTLDFRSMEGANGFEDLKTLPVGETTGSALSGHDAARL